MKLLFSLRPFFFAVKSIPNLLYLRSGKQKHGNTHPLSTNSRYRLSF